MQGGYIFDIQGYSVHDGPGCRTVIFMKGCTLQCKWCSNPEGITDYPLPLYNPSKCIGDKQCITACPKSAISSNDSENIKLIIKRELCRECYDNHCAVVCQTGALKTAGYYITLDELYKKISRDRNYWGEDGGITLTGGEPLSQPEFAKQILRKCYEAYIHTAIETCGNVAWKNIAELLDFSDWIFYDIKHVDSIKHKVWTGADNRQILDNLQRLAKHFDGRLIVRTPVIPGFNDTPEEMNSIAEFIASAGIKEINLLPLHHFGKSKYELLDYPYFDDELSKPDHTKLKEFSQLFGHKGIECYEGDKTPF